MKDDDDDEKLKVEIFYLMNENRRFQFHDKANQYVKSLCRRERLQLLFTQNAKARRCRPI
jgi:hypothetical protein